MKRWQRGHQADLLPYALRDISNYCWKGNDVTPFCKVKVSFQSSPEAFFQRADRELALPLYSQWVGCVICLLFLQHKLSEICGGELASGALPSLPWDSETAAPAPVFSFFICFFFLKHQSPDRCFVPLYFWQWLILLLHYIYLKALVVLTLQINILHTN